ncbi:Hypothetical_protein [Hexamita inflata]|uniref:Hypothetical_protein n=1 Tax=Hexamita inflata TaxID=28002 RepID=A0AA86R6U3_9EUKA|nr:Hypothetical protein HINF_LOCUS54998 [Hexamita inflata]
MSKQAKCQILGFLQSGSPTVTFCSQVFSNKYCHSGLEKIQYRLELVTLICQNVISVIIQSIYLVTPIPSLVSWATQIIVNNKQKRILKRSLFTTQLKQIFEVHGRID